MTGTYTLEPEEENQRKWWARVAIGYPFYLFVLLVLPVIFIVQEPNSGEVLFLETAMGQLIVAITGSLIQLLISWHCAYDNYGTRWLMFWLIISPILFLRDLSAVFQDPEIFNLEPVPLTITIVFTLVFSLPIFIWHYILTIKMRKINKKIQAQYKAWLKLQKQPSN